MLDSEVIPSPSCHCAGPTYLILNLIKEQPHETEQFSDMSEHFFMGGLFTSTNEASRGFEILELMLAALSSGGFKLEEWAMNCPELGRRMTEQSPELDIQVSYDQPDAKFLGVGWDQSSDTP